MEINISQYSDVIITVGAIGAMLKYFMSRLDKKFDEISKDIKDIRSRLDRLEVRVEERTLKVVSIPEKALGEN